MPVKREEGRKILLFKIENWTHLKLKSGLYRKCRLVISTERSAWRNLPTWGI